MNLQTVDLAPMFPIQKKLDSHILDKFPELKEVDLFDKRVLSLQIELGELANELPEVFKYWSHKKNQYDKALEEYVDCLHFILSIGNHINFDYEGVYQTTLETDIVVTFINLQGTIADMRSARHRGYTQTTHEAYQHLLNEFIRLGALIGFSWEQIEKAYYDKNKKNYERQENGY